MRREWVGGPVSGNFLQMLAVVLAGMGLLTVPMWDEIHDADAVVIAEVERIVPAPTKKDMLERAQEKAGMEADPPVNRVTLRVLDDLKGTAPSTSRLDVDVGMRELRLFHEGGLVLTFLDAGWGRDRFRSRGTTRQITSEERGVYSQVVAQAAVLERDAAHEWYIELMCHARTRALALDVDREVHWSDHLSAAQRERIARAFADEPTTERLAHVLQIVAGISSASFDAAVTQIFNRQVSEVEPEALELFLHRVGYTAVQIPARPAPSDLEKIWKKAQPYIQRHTRGATGAEPESGDAGLR